MVDRCGERKALFALMMQIQRQMMSRMEPALAAEWVRLELTAPQLKLLVWLASQETQPMNVIARALGIGMPATTSLVDKLVDAGLALREHSPVDRRMVLVQASKRGHEMIAQFRRVHEDKLRRIISYVPDGMVSLAISGTEAILCAVQRMLEVDDSEGVPSTWPAGTGDARDREDGASDEPLHLTEPAVSITGGASEAVSADSAGRVPS